MRAARKNAAPTNVRICKNACAADVSSFNASARDVSWMSRRLIDARRTLLARTLSREFWQRKNFQANAPASHRGSPKPDFFRESRNADSCSARTVFGTPPTIDGGARTRRRAQTPSFDFKRSFTDCGLALPPDDFITWPTNQPISCGLALAC